jgi:hypothetical protein
MIIVYIQVKRILKKHNLKLLQNQKDYLKKYIQSGGQDLVMKAQIFFHAAATKRYRINTIMGLDTEDGKTMNEHFEKAALLWEEYKNRLVAQLMHTCNLHSETLC